MHGSDSIGNYNQNSNYRESGYLPRNESNNSGSHTTVIVQPNNPVVVAGGGPGYAGNYPDSGYYGSKPAGGKFSGTDMALGKAYII